MLPVCWVEEGISPPADEKRKDSYGLGYEFGANLKRQGVDIDVDVLLSAFREGLEGKMPSLSPEEIRENPVLLKRKVITMNNRRLREIAANNLEEGKAFLDANRSKEGVKTLASGLQCRVLQEGSGPIPKATDSVKLHYRGTPVNGNEFDSSYFKGEPVTMPVVGVIKGWTEALQLMKVGSKWQIFVPPNLAYGERQFGRIPPNSTLTFELELLALTDSPVAKAAGSKPGDEPDPSRVKS